MATVGERLRRLRLRRGLTVLELEKAADIPNATLYEYERDATIPSLPGLLRLAGVLRFSLAEFDGAEVRADHRRRKATTVD
jgi:transcriptional regulator with XRE-family HTH domain